MDERKPHGPYETESDAMRDAAHVHHAYRALDRRRGLMDQINEGLLLGALREAGVELGAYDRRIVGWLAEYESWTVQVLTGWIERAHAAGHAAGNLGANWAHHVAAQCEPDESAAAPEQQVTHHAVMRHGVGGPECGTARVWEPMTRAWKDVTCPACLAALDVESGGAS